MRRAKSTGRRATALVVALLLSLGFAQSWQIAKSPSFIVQTASSWDALYLKQIFSILGQARKDLASWGLEAPQTVTVVIHPDLASYTGSTKAPWFVAAVATRGKNRIDTQRIRILLERGTLERTLRHELFHLAQPQGWPRRRAEGWAMRFAGDRPLARPLWNVSNQQLDRLLADPPSREMLYRAMATAYVRTSNPP